MNLELKGNHVSLDIETLGKTPGDAILSIGAVMFSSKGIDQYHPSYYHVLSTKDNLAYGLELDIDTLAWWMAQSDDARKVLRKSFDGGGTVGETLDGLDLWMRSVPDLSGVWTNGPAFDAAFIRVAAKRTGRRDPWDYRLDRDFRTIKDLSGLKWEDVRGVGGTAHDALDDAGNQAKFIVQAFEKMRHDTTPTMWGGNDAQPASPNYAEFSR